MAQRDRTFRFQALVLAVCYMDGHVDQLREQGKVTLEDEYAICYIDMPNGKDIRIIFISKTRKTDYPEIPVCLVARENIQDEEWDTMSELQIGNKGTAN